ncbi:hypothetical protein A1O7_05424 [Cladophialophora yegresii CBS 114405]|uniref:Copper transport protein n=1 Tax=Cladophialophora yegresii CBS 114405 TaxID=1182544 RepID=W9W0H4_9EURO|nr:uncharacterized protein A1O7_05424 [Cladophialophora yegresii CBS 114405]EXJ58001.1 hypothetical protein A1O7_05424 [Cladophialophora yegresii CBS 114405]
MLFTWDTRNLCIVFRWWRVAGPMSLALSLLAIILLCAGYEGVREVSRRVEARQAAQLSTHSISASTTEKGEHESSSLLRVGRDTKGAAERQGTIIRATLYAVQVFYSFFIMLLFMTYNGWVMLAVAVGAFVGYIAFSNKMPSTKTVACH